MDSDRLLFSHSATASTQMKTRSCPPGPFYATLTPAEQRELRDLLQPKFFASKHWRLGKATCAVHTIERERRTRSPSDFDQPPRWSGRRFGSRYKR